MIMICAMCLIVLEEIFWMWFYNIGHGWFAEMVGFEISNESHFWVEWRKKIILKEKSRTIFAKWVGVMGSEEVSDGIKFHPVAFGI